MMLTLYGRPDSSAVSRVMWTIGELGLPHRRIDWGGAHGGNDDPSYRALNPAGRIPAIQLEDGRGLWESNAIIRYLTGLQPQSGWLPADPVERAQAEAWMDWSDALSRAVSGVRSSYRKPAPDFDDMRRASTAATPALALLDRQLVDGRAYVMGAAPTIADLALGVWTHRWFRVPEDVPGKPDLPALRAWYDRLLLRPAYRIHVAEAVSAGPQRIGHGPAGKGGE